MKEKFVSTIPDVGMVATLLMHSDRVVYVITKISPSGKTLTLHRAALTKYKEWGALIDTKPVQARQNAEGHWQQIGHPRYRPFFIIGVANPYHDRSF